jgi:hypothetical protein
LNLYLRVCFPRPLIFKVSRHKCLEAASIPFVGIESKVL